MIVIHIGLRKAGSSTLQAFLHANAEALRARGVEYPLVGRAGWRTRDNHLNLVHDLRGHQRFDPACGDLAELGTFWRTATAETMILSSENFEECRADEARRLRQALRRPGEAVRIVLVLRDLADLMASSYGQKVKNGEKKHHFERFFAQRIEEPRVDYFQTAERWAEAFGWDSLRLLQLGEGDLIDGFLSIVGVSGEGLTRPGNENVTPGWRVLEAVRALSTGRHGLPPDHPLLAPPGLNAQRLWVAGEVGATVGESMGWNADRGRYLTRAQAEQCRDIYRRAIVTLNQRIAEPLPVPLALDDYEERAALPDARLIPPAELRAFYDAVAERAYGRPQGSGSLMGVGQ